VDPFYFSDNGGEEKCIIKTDGRGDSELGSQLAGEEESNDGVRGGPFFCKNKGNLRQL
jgi:hypothetical protein